MVSMWLADSTKDSRVDSRPAERPDNNKRSVNGTGRSSADEKKKQIEIERVPVDGPWDDDAHFPA